MCEDKSYFHANRMDDESAMQEVDLEDQINLNSWKRDKRRNNSMQEEMS